MFVCLWSQYVIFWLCVTGSICNGRLARYAKLWVTHAPGMPGTFPPPLRASDPDMHHGTCLMHVPWCMPGSLTSGFIWSSWQGKRSRHSRCMRSPQFYVSDKRPIARWESFTIIKAHLPTNNNVISNARLRMFQIIRACWHSSISKSISCRGK